MSRCAFCGSADRLRAIADDHVCERCWNAFWRISMRIARDLAACRRLLADEALAAALAEIRGLPTTEGRPDA